MNTTQTADEKWEQTELAINVARDNADHRQPDPKWSDEAFVYLKLFLREYRGEFCTDQVRDWATEHGLAEPPNRRAWGSVMLKASRQDVIRKTCIKNHHYPNSENTHTRPTAFWIGVVPTL